jgi:Rho GTPase-activating protein 39
VSDIQLFSESEYAKQYFSTHRSGFIFKRKIPMEQLMAWQKVSKHSLELPDPDYEL